MELLYANNAESTLAADCLAAAVAVTVAAADAAKFPQPNAGGATNQAFKVTLMRKNVGTKEIALCTARAGAVLTIVRAQEGTAAIDFFAGDAISARPTKEEAELWQQASNGKHTAIASANNLAVPSGTGYVQITGAVQINLLADTNWKHGNPLRLKFNAGPTVKHNQAAAGANRPIYLRGLADRVMAAGSILTLIYDETDRVFYEAY